MAKIELDLPLPPSLNSLFSTCWETKRRFKSQKYKDWESAADAAMIPQPKYTITGDNWLSCTYSIFTPLYYKNGNKRVIDEDNYKKAVVDYLTKAVAGFKDHLVLNSYTQKVDSIRNSIIITIEECPD